MKTFRLWVLVACAGFGIDTASAAAPLLDLSLAPRLSTATRSIDAVDVTIRVSGMNSGDKPSLKMPLVIYNVETVAKTLENLVASDAKGPLQLTIQDDPEGGREFNRHWLADRSIEGALQIHYRAPITNRLSPLGGAPPIELRSDAAAFSAGGAAFLLLPQTQDEYQVAVHWDLKQIPGSAVGLSSFGQGDRQSETPLPLDFLSRTFFMGGQVGAYPQPAPPTGFFSAWQGTPPFEALSLMKWTGDLHAHFASFFKERTPAPYGVFLRPNLVNPGGGVSQEHSFVATFDGHTREMDLKFTLSHEMLHTYIGGLGGHEDSNLANSWFSEGLAVYYQGILPLRYGQISTADFLADLNKTAARYYTDALSNTPNSDIPANFWSNTLVRVLPYDRGSLYFATVNDQVRKASHGKRSLDDLLLPLLQRRQEKGAIERSDWEEALTRELGQAGLQDFHSMLAGKQVLPASDAFGACFRRTTKPLRRYELGFDPKVMAERQRIVRELQPGSAAARAGLKNGDEILKPFGQDTVQQDQDKTITLDIRREGKTLSITYLPRGETVQAYQWERIPNIADSACLN
jgi:hypothetical protein